MKNHSYFSEDDESQTRQRYSERLKLYGQTPATLGWNKGKQSLRFKVLTSQIDCGRCHILDIGCGFGNLLDFLNANSKNPLSYTGVDIVPEFIDIAKKQHYLDNANFFLGEFNRLSFECQFDYAIASGIFNHKLIDETNYDFIEATISKALSICTTGIAFDFLSDKVDYRLDHTFHSSPEKILSIAYKYSRNVLLRNDYMPFEFSLFIFKDDSFAKEDTVFNRLKNNYSDLSQGGTHDRC